MLTSGDNIALRKEAIAKRTPKQQRIAAFFDAQFGFVDGKMTVHWVTDKSDKGSRGRVVPDWREKVIRNLKGCDPYDDLWGVIRTAKDRGSALYFCTAALDSELAEQRLRDGYASRRSAETALEMPTIFIDFDAKMLKFKNADHMIVEVTKLLKDKLPAEFQPAFSVKSGGGLHVYWRLKELAYKENFDRVVAVRQKLARLFGGDLAATDVARIMRVPGSINHKYKPGVEAEITEDFDPQNRVELDDFESWIGELEVAIVEGKRLLPMPLNMRVAPVVKAAKSAKTNRGQNAYTDYADDNGYAKREGPSAIERLDTAVCGSPGSRNAMLAYVKWLILSGAAPDAVVSHTLSKSAKHNSDQAWLQTETDIIASLIPGADKSANSEKLAKCRARFAEIFGDDIDRFVAESKQNPSKTQALVSGARADQGNKGASILPIQQKKGERSPDTDLRGDANPGDKRYNGAVIADALGVWREESDDREVVSIDEGNFSITVRKTFEGLIRAQPGLSIQSRIFSRAGGLITVDGDSAFEIDPPGLTLKMAELLSFRDSGDPGLPHKLLAGMITSEYARKFPELVWLRTCPTILPDGELMLETGYNAKYKIALILPTDLKMPEIPENPTKTDALDAIKLLKELIEESPFVDGASKSVWLSALLSSVARPSLPFVPLHTASAPAAGTGKSWLFELIGVIQTGKNQAAVSDTPNVEERQKRIDAELIRGASTIHLDNVASILNSSIICQAVTTDELTVRVLGASKSVTIPNQAMFFANGNNLTVTDDLKRRTLMARLDAKVEKPHLRQFDGDAKALVKADRGKYITACLVILRAFRQAAVRGEATKVSRLASFNEWSDTVCSALVWLGQANPMETMRSVEADDPVGEAMGALLESWYKEFQQRPQSTGEVIKFIESASYENSELHQAIAAVLPDRNGSDGNRGVRLGKYLARIKDKIANGFIAVKVAHSHKGIASQWQVLRIIEQGSEAPAGENVVSFKRTAGLSADDLVLGDREDIILDKTPRF